MSDVLVVECALEEELDEVALQEALVLQRLRELQQVTQHNLVARRTEAPVRTRAGTILITKESRLRLHCHFGLILDYQLQI